MLPRSAVALLSLVLALACGGSNDETGSSSGVTYHATVATEAPPVHCAHILPDSATCGN